MGVRRKPRRTREAELSFEAISIEGGLLSAEWLSKVAQLGAGMQTEADYRIPKGLNLRDEIGRYWRIAQAYWSEAQTAQRGGADSGEIARRFVTALLREALGFSSLAPAMPLVIDGRIYPIGLAALGGRVPIVVGPFDAENGIDTLSTAFGDGGRRRSAFGLAQEYLNAQDGALWGIACDGRQLRIVRDNASLTRPAWIAADLERIFLEERYADFAALWLIAHETRFGREAEPVAACSLEAWRSAGLEEGTRAREHLRRGVEEALLALGQGFLAHGENHALRSALEAGTLSTKAYQNELLRLVYRIIFLLTVEERGVLHASGASDASRQLYEHAYSFRHLRERSLKRSAHDRFSDLWEAAKIVFQGLAAGEPRLALPALAGIFARSQCPHLDASKLENRWLLLAVFKLAWLKDAGNLARVNWRDMGPEELGSVYESLLELTPQVTRDGRQFAFGTGNETKGNARKTTGSYYTPDNIVQVLLDSALEPVIAGVVATNPASPVDALLELSIVDPACGSGHFLLAAARRLAAHVARLTVNGTPSMPEYRHALRQIVGRCIYGVDVNPMAVELCKVALWMEAVEPGLPLNFLDSHIQRGNALIGTTPELMAGGIPDAAWEPIEGDDRKTASALKKRNKDDRQGQGSFDFAAPRTVQQETEALARAVGSLDSASDASLHALTNKEATWESIRRSTEFLHQKFVADAWCAAFVWPKQTGELADAARTTDYWKRIRDAEAQPSTLTARTVDDLAERYAFFHWHLQFPHVFANGGFSVVLGNPPWERVTLSDKAWFATRDPEIAKARTDAERQRLITRLKATNPNLYREFLQAKRSADGEKAFLRRSGVYPLCGKGDVNTFAVFAELGTRLARARAGLVLPTGIVTADTTQDFAAYLITSKRLISVLDFDNRGGIFPAVQGNIRFSLVTIGRDAVDAILGAAQLRNPTDALNPSRIWYLTHGDIARINPNTLTLPLFSSNRDAVIVADIHSRLRCLDESGKVYPGRWNSPMQRMLHMGDDSGLFKTESQLLADGFVKDGERWLTSDTTYVPLLEAKLCYQYDHRAGTFDGIPEQERFGTHPATRDLSDSEHEDPLSFSEPRFWVPLADVKDRIGERSFLLAIRDAVSAVADSRSLVATITPAFGAGHTLNFLFPESADDCAFICAWLNAFVTDFVFRSKSSGGHASFFLLRQLPIPRRDDALASAAWAPRTSVSHWVVPRVAELTYSSWSVDAFAAECGVTHPPFRWNAERRFLIRCELDAAFFHLYGLSFEDASHVMDSFPIVRKNDERLHGEYRTKRVILEIYQAMAEAATSGQQYQTRLYPAPADPRVAHEVTSSAKAPKDSHERGEPVSEIRVVPRTFDFAAVRDEAWARPHAFARGEVQAAIVAVLKQFGEPVSPHQVRLAALYCLEPQLLVPRIESAERSTWIRVVGADAQREQSSSLDQTASEWGKALSSLRGWGVLIETSQPETWALGTSDSGIDTSGWADGRAAFVVSVLARQLTAVTDTRSTERLPELVREWLAHAA